ncbi:MAG: hypothetical protein HYT70_01625 [Candidatus Aenigmarchaeota archaeon]|nr:hypothetical protein [Candidatus Aenigmarchaeota archaeon]
MRKVVCTAFGLLALYIGTVIPVRNETVETSRYVVNKVNHYGEGVIFGVERTLEGPDVSG